MIKKTREELKAIAVDVLKKMNIHSPFVQQFEKEDKVTMFISGLGYTIDANTEDHLLAVIKGIESNGERVVYAVSKNALDGEIIYTLLLVTQEDSGVDTVIGEHHVDGIPVYHVFSYCYNRDYQEFSEYGYVTVQERFGGVRRVGVKW